MPIPPVDPITILTTGLNFGIRIFEITYQLKSVEPQTADLLKTIDHINRNIKEAQRLRQQKDALLSSEEAEWMDSIIQDTLDARLAVARLIEPVRIDQQTKKSISLANRALWILRDNPNVANKHRKLTATHQSLTSLIACLYSKDAIVITPADISMTQHLAPPPYDPEMAQLFERRTLRRRRKSMSNFQDGGRERVNSLESVSLKADPPIPSTLSLPLPSWPATYTPEQGLCIDETVARTSQMKTFGLSEAALWASCDDLIPVTTPNASPTSPGYVDESSALHALQHLNLANADSAMPARPPRPPKVPLSVVSQSQSNDIVERATVINPVKRVELENNYTTSPTRRMKTSWLAYHATRSDAGHYQPFQ